MTTLGERIRRARTARGMTQEELGVIAGLAPNAISAIERGRVVWPERLRKILAAVGLEVRER